MLGTTPNDVFFEVRDSPVHGRGVFATRSIPAGTRLVEYTGRRLRADEVDQRVQHPEDQFHTFLFSLGSGDFIDAAQGGSDARFINHSCEPNCDRVEEEGRIFIEALHDIAAGEELNYDYSLQLDVEQTLSIQRAFACRCGAARCRGTLLGPGPAVSESRAVVLEDQDDVILEALDDTGSSAALATLLSMHVGLRVTERDIAALLGVVTPGRRCDPTADRRVSFLDLKRCVSQLGLGATGYAQLDLPALRRLGPGIVQVDLGGRIHFSVFAGAAADDLVLADPILGRLRLSETNFLDTWQSRSALTVTRTSAGKLEPR